MNVREINSLITDYEVSVVCNYCRNRDAVFGCNRAVVIGFAVVLNLNGIYVNLVVATDVYKL